MSHCSSSSSGSSTSEDSEGSWVPTGAIYENVDYPLSFVPTGAGSTTQWNVRAPGLPDSKIVLQNEAVRFPVRFMFQRAAGQTGAPLPLQDGVQVTVTVRGVDDVTGVPLNWEEEFYPVPFQWEPTKFRSMVVGPYSGALGGGETFIFSSNVQQGRTVINLSPAVEIVPYSDDVPPTYARYPDPEDGSLMVESTASLCLLGNTIDIPDSLHSVVWPVVCGNIPTYPVALSEGIPGYPRSYTPIRPVANVLMQGSWVWKRT